MSKTSTDDVYVGVVAPYDFALDREIWRWASKRTNLLITRTPQLGLPSTVEMAEHISNDDTVRHATQQVLTTDPAAVLYLCTSGSFVNGPAGERRLREVMCEAGAPVAVTTAGALVDACTALDVRRIAIATPYIESVTDKLRFFLDRSGTRVTSSVGLGRAERIWQLTEDDVRELVLAADHPEADAVFVSCTNLRTYSIIGQLEADLGKPVLTANQVSIWAAMRAAGCRQPDIKQRLFLDTWQPKRGQASQSAVVPLES